MTVGTVHIVEGIGNAKRAGRAAARVAAAAAANGWSPAVIGLDDVAAEAGSMTRLVLCGGDGLIHRAIQMVAGRAAEVAVVPAGTGNDLARAFAIGGTAAIALAASPPGTARVDAIDLMTVTRHDGQLAHAATVVTAGYSSRVNATANEMRFPRGPLKYTLAAMREMGRLRPRDVRLTMRLPDGSCEVIERRLTLMAVGNTAYFGGGMKICPAADPCDGELEVLAVGPLGRIDLMRWLPRVFGGRHLGHPAVSTSTATEVTIETPEALRADGEPFGAAGAVTTVRVMRAGLHLLTPPASSANLVQPIG